MPRQLKPMIAALVLFTCSVSLAQPPKTETFASPANPLAPDLVEPSDYVLADSPSVHLRELKHADAKELAESLTKIFEEYVKSGQLAIVGDSRARRIVIRANDKVLIEMSKVIEELDMPIAATDESTRFRSPVQSQLKDDDSSSEMSDNEMWSRRIVEDIKSAAKDPSRSSTLQALLKETVQRDFEMQQEELQTELNTLRSKIDGLEQLLAKREVQKNAIILRRIQSMLSSPALGASSTTDPSYTQPQSPQSMSSEKSVTRTMPFHTNINLDPNSFADEITTILQAELLGEDGMQIFLDGKATSLSTGIPFQLSNTFDRLEFEVASRSDRRAFVAVKLECEHASDEFWKRIATEKIQLNVTQDELDRVSGSQMVMKCVYLPKDPGKGLTWLVWDQVDAGVDLRERSEELGQPVITMTITRQSVRANSAAERTGWQHNYGAKDQVQAYFNALAEYCRLKESVGAKHPQADEALRELFAITATDQDIRAAAKDRQQELTKHMKAQAALSPETELVVPLLSNAMTILIDSGRQGLEKWLANESNTKSSDLTDSFALPKSSDSEVYEPKQ